MDKGMQLSGILNVSSAMQRGLQLGTINFSDPQFVKYLIETYG